MGSCFVAEMVKCALEFFLPLPWYSRVLGKWLPGWELISSSHCKEVVHVARDGSWVTVEMMCIPARLRHSFYVLSFPLCQKKQGPRGWPGYETARTWAPGIPTWRQVDS